MIGERGLSSTADLTVDVDIDVDIDVDSNIKRQLMPATSHVIFATSRLRIEASSKLEYFETRPVSARHEDVFSVSCVGLSGTQTWITRPQTAPLSLTCGMCNS